MIDFLASSQENQKKKILLGHQQEGQYRKGNGSQSEPLQESEQGTVQTSKLEKVQKAISLVQ